MSHAREFTFLERIKRTTKRQDYVVPRMPKIKVRRTRTQRAPRSADSENVKKARRDRKAAVNAAIEEAQEEMWRRAEEMATALPGKKKADFYYRLILQRPTFTLATRRVNKWNAFLHGEVTKRNNELEPGAERYRSSDLVGELREQWNGMTERQKKEVTKEYVKELQELRDTKKYASQNTQRGAFHDARETISAVIVALLNMFARTGVQAMLVTTRGQPDDWSKPHVFYTSDAIPEFFNLFTKCTLSQFVTRLEAYIVSGVSAVISNHKERLLKAKADLAKLVLEKLNAVAPVRIAQMNYKNIDEALTRRHGIILRGYPPGISFCSPSKLPGLHEVELITAAWQSGTTHWYKMTADEHTAWKTGRPESSENTRAPAPTEDSDDEEERPLAEVVAQASGSTDNPVIRPPAFPASTTSSTPSAPPPASTAPPAASTTSTPASALTAGTVPPASAPPSATPPPSPSLPTTTTSPIPAATPTTLPPSTPPRAEVSQASVLVDSTVDNQPVPHPPTVDSEPAAHPPTGDSNTVGSKRAAPPADKSKPVKTREEVPREGRLRRLCDVPHR
ncbi:hypothetical protein EVJ58_g10358 [Rhodofomes roseus]|uniref:Uncharacterized protein n=1 Tax=Rhodofomes roseus TaxID=34475 RepID=A0A4Y9XR10_9APHY|nr:hypothetical protein EVJ58_g10358 [Rhodofomes roseus]